jgi:hypothetical protein
VTSCERRPSAGRWASRARAPRRRFIPLIAGFVASFLSR